MDAAEPNQPALLSEQLRFEYDHLHQGILHNENITNQILGGTVILISALISIAFSDSVKEPLLKAFLFFLAQIIAGVGLWQTLERMRGTFIIASYLRTFIEPKTTGLKWENRLERFRARLQKVSLLTYYINYQIYTYPILLTITYILSVVYLLIFGLLPAPIVYVAIIFALFDGVLTLLGFLKAWEWLTTHTIYHAKTFDPIWLDVKQEEEKQPPPNPQDTARMSDIERFKIIHSEIHREHDLISNRMGWYVTSQAFLLTAFVVSGGNGHPYQEWIRWVIPSAGIVISILIWLSIFAATYAMRKLRVSWFALQQNDSLQGIMFGRPTWPHNLGMAPPLVIPLGFVIVWVIALGFSS